MSNNQTDSQLNALPESLAAQGAPAVLPPEKALLPEDTSSIPKPGTSILPPRSSPPASGCIAPQSALTPTPGESARAFAAFFAYLELGPRRRYATVARQVGASLVSIKRWAIQHDWRGRLSIHAARHAEPSVSPCAAELPGDLGRVGDLRERQSILAAALLDMAEHYFERLDDLDFEHVRLPDVCRALELVSRLVGQDHQSDPAAVPDHGLRDQLAALLDQAFRETKTPVSS